MICYCASHNVLLVHESEIYMLILLPMQMMYLFLHPLLQVYNS